MQNMIFKRKLPIPKEIKEQYPLTAELAQSKPAGTRKLPTFSPEKAAKWC